MRTAIRFGALSAATALTLILSACGGDSMDMSPSASSSMSEASPTDSAEVADEHNDQDVMFSQMMIAHHQGAIEMSQMAATRASSQEVKDLALKIEAEQQPEMELMTSWLTSWGESMEADSSMSGMDHSSEGGSSMSGMMTEDRMTELSASSGVDFDKMFLQMMIEHHTGALEMAKTEQADGQSPDAVELAGSIVASQTAEIDQMNQMLSTIG